MADSALKNGFTPIGNELMEAFARTQLSGHESRVLWALFRKTFGWHKEEDYISLSQFAKLTGLHPRKAWETIRKLTGRKIITSTENRRGQGNKYRFNTSFELWKTSTQIRITSTENRKAPLRISVETKETIQKKNINSYWRDKKADFAGKAGNDSGTAPEDPIARALRKGWY